MEDDAYAAFARRIVRSLGRRIATGNIEDLAALGELRVLVDDTMSDTIEKLRAEHGYSWTDVGRVLGITRQSAQERYGRRTKAEQLDGSPYFGLPATDQDSPS